MQPIYDMKKNFNILKIKLLFYLLLFLTNALQAQQITTDDSLSVTDLIQNNLADGCVEISNVSSFINGSENNLSSFGLFNRAGSNFPFESGIVLTTGDVNEAGNTQITSALNTGTGAWGEDPDLNTALGNTETYLNTTSIQFDFISGTEEVQFNYILASEEYFGNNPCVYSDGFAFLIKETGTTNPFVNIALVPGTTTPVNTTTVHDEVVGDNGCPAANNQFFEGFNVGDTNYNGRTTVLTAATTITANVSYTIKLIIADARDQFFDSAVFIEANSFDNSVDLGEDISTCDASATLDATVTSSSANYAWTVNGNTPLPQFDGDSIITVDQNGTYTVEVSIPLNGSACTFTDSVVVNVNNIETGPDLTDIQLCDDASNDGTETFDFSSAEAELLALLPQPETYSVTFHNSQADANSGNANITNTTAYPNTTSPEEIFIRAVNSLGCVYVSSFNIIVNEFPIITDPTDQFIICADDGGAFLPILNDDITGMNPDYTVTYHNSPADANSGNNPLSFPYNPSTDPETVFIRITTSAGCFTTADVELTVNQNPVLETEIQQIDACEQDDDGFEPFDITSVEADILLGATGVTVTYHENLTDAENGANPIADPTNYTNTTAEFQNVYIRVVDDANGCVTIRPIELHVQLLYTGTDFMITPNNPVEYGECDNDFDGFVEFDLMEISGLILNNVDDTTVQYFENDPVANPTEPEIDQTVPYSISSDTTIFVTLNRTGPTCEYNNLITLIIFDGVSVNPLTIQDYCDTDDDLSSIPVNFDSFIPYLETEVISPGNYNFTFYPTQLDAENDINQYANSQFITPTSNPQSFFVSFTNQESGCLAIEELMVNFLPAPSINPANIIYRCNDDGTNDAVINLEDVIPEINNTPNVNFTFFETEANALQDIEEIPTPTAYNAITSTLFARVENTTTGCFDIQSFDVIVNPRPLDITIEDYVVCLPAGQTQGDFFFEMEKDPEILGTQTNMEVFYFTSLSGAQNYDPANGMTADLIDKTVAYQNTAMSETIYVRVENLNDPDCNRIMEFQINVGEIPEYNTAYGNLEVCDDSSNDGQAIFDLTEFSTVLQQGSSQSLTITYYLTADDALNQQNAIPNPDTYENPAGQNPQTLYFNIDNGTICDGIDNFEIIVNPNPIVITPTPLTTCDTDLDGVSTFDLTAVEAEVLANLGPRQGVELNYFPTQADYDSGTNQIPSSQTINYSNISNPQTVIIEILNTNTTCFNTVELVLNVEVPPTITNSTIEICDNAANEYDLNEATPILIGSQTDVDIDYYASQNDAETETNPLDLNYNYTSNSTVIWARASFIGSTCFYIEQFTLNIINPPTLVAPGNLVTCDDSDFDLIEPFNLNGQAEIALGTQNPSDFIISYHNSQQEADDNTEALTDLNVLATTQSFFIRVESIASGCVSTTSFQTIVNRKPELELNDAALCLDNLPFVANANTGVSTDTYLWSTGEMTPSIEINNIGTYSVTVTTAQGCTNSETFSLVESEAATIEFTETVDFSSPNNSITVNVTGIGDYLFQLDGGAPQTSNVFSDVSYGVHLVTVIDQLGCNSVTKEVIVFDIPPFFTPNNDGFNDTWHVVGASELEGTIIYIFDRYGKLLKTLLHTSQGWNGTYNGYDMPTSDYWYVANIKQGEKEFELKGHFTLKR